MTVGVQQCSSLMVRCSWWGQGWRIRYYVCQQYRPVYLSVSASHPVVDSRGSGPLADEDHGAPATSRSWIQICLASDSPVRLSSLVWLLPLHNAQRTRLSFYGFWFDIDFGDCPLGRIQHPVCCSPFLLHCTVSASADCVTTHVVQHLICCCDHPPTLPLHSCPLAVRGASSLDHQSLPTPLLRPQTPPSSAPCAATPLQSSPSPSIPASHPWPLRAATTSLCWCGSSSRSCVR